VSVASISASEARAQLWRLGNLRFLTLPHQRRLYDFLDPRPVLPGEPLVRVANCSRRIGKSTTGLIRASERCIKKPRAQVRYAAATGKELRKITIPIMRKLTEQAPEEVRPRWLQFDQVFEFPNGSLIHMAGADAGNADALRGTESDLNEIEEAGNVAELDYLVRDILLPQTLTTLAPTFLIGTPPRTPAHDFATFAAQAEARNAYLRMTIDENTSINPRIRAAYAEEAGGEQSSTWRREYRCEFVVDEESAVVPEFTDDRASRIVQPAPPPTYEFPTVAMDVGFEDFHAILYGYWHFAQAKLVIQAEDVLARATTDRIAAVMRARESDLWAGKLRVERPVARWSDTDLRLIADLSELHKLPVAATAKDDKEAQVNALRMLVKDEKIIIDPSCRTLIRQLKTAVWKDNRKEFERTKTEGHFDCVDALIYLLRNVDRYANPYPSLPEGITDEQHWIPAHLRKRESDDAAALGQLFKARRVH
jgi:hypothetical protein